MFQVTPPKLAATVGAVFNAALQLGAAIGSAIISSIQASIAEGKPANTYDGRAAGFWFLFAVVCMMTASVALFYRADRKPAAQPNGETAAELGLEKDQNGSSKMT